MSKWNGKRFSVYTSDEKSALGLINQLGEQTNYNTDEVERLTISDNKKVSHDEMHNTYKIDENANFTGSWHGLKEPTLSDEGLKATVQKHTTEIAQLQKDVQEGEITHATKEELRVERNRIDLLTKNQGEQTEGNAELIDIRNGADGKVYETAGQSIREQFKGVTNIILPKTYIDFSKELPNEYVGGADKRVTATFNTIYVEQIAENSGNGGLNVKLDYTKINNISFDLDYQGMGANLGIYFFRDDKLIGGYVGYNDTPKDFKLTRHVSLNLNKTEIENLMFSKGANNMRFIVWNATNPIVGGYNYLYNITVNGYTPPISYMEELKRTTENIKYNNVKMTSELKGDTQSLITWGSNVNYTNNGAEIHYQYTLTSGNNGLMTNPFIAQNTFVHFSFKVNEVTSGGMNLYVKGTSTTGATLYMGIKQFLTVGEHTEIIDLNNLVVYRALDLSKPINILIANIGVTDIKFTDVKVFESEYLEYNYIKETLGETLKTFDNELSVIKSEVGANQGNEYLVSPNGSKFMLNVSDDGTLTTIPYVPQKTLFIGNSLLLGYGTFGMTASNSKNDYYYHVTNYIKTLKSNATFEKLQGSGFEGCTSQSEVNTWINNNLENKANDFNLIYVQLGDNVNTTDKTNNFKTSCEYLLKYLRNKFKNARIIWVGMWYSTEEKVNIITNACNNTGCSFINIRGLYTSENQGKIGDTITADDGTQSTVSSSGVASHPNDKGMKAIADLMIEKTFN